MDIINLCVIYLWSKKYKPDILRSKAGIDKHVIYALTYSCNPL